MAKADKAHKKEGYWKIIQGKITILLVGWLIFLLAFFRACAKKAITRIVMAVIRKRQS
jgi:hypothetical protein